MSTVHEPADTAAAQTRFDDLRALFINCTLKRSPELSHTQGLIDLSRAIMQKQGVGVEVVRAVDLEIATGVWPDMTEHGWAVDAWPALYRDAKRHNPTTRHGTATGTERTILIRMTIG